MKTKTTKYFKNIAHLIRESRLDNRLSQTKLAELTGIGKTQFISNIERGICSLPIQYVPALCDALDIPIATIRDALIQDAKANIQLGINQALQQDKQVEKSTQPFSIL